MKNFKKHPSIQNLQIKNDGSEFLYYGEKLEIRDHQVRGKHVLKVVRVNDAYHSVPKLILETHGPEKPEGRQYALYKDGNIENLHPNNLYWSPKHVNTKSVDPIQHNKTSKLSLADLGEIYHKNIVRGVTKRALAKEYGVSEMSILRAVRRFEKLLKKNNN